VNLFEYPVVADINGVPDIIKSGVSINALVNLILPGQNLPFNHLILAWDSSTGQFLPSFPKATDDYMLLSEPSVADIGGGTPSIVIGNGLYLMHAYNMLGAEPSGWPKPLGGWVSGSSAIGDMLGDGHVEVSAATREGYLFIFDTDGAAAGNIQWPSFHHDNRNTRNTTVTPTQLYAFCNVTLSGNPVHLDENRETMKTIAAPCLAVSACLLTSCSSQSPSSSNHSYSKGVGGIGGRVQCRRQCDLRIDSQSTNRRCADRAEPGLPGIGGALGAYHQDL
jgi:hypothetical protein